MHYHYTVPTDAVLYTWTHPSKLKYGSIELTQELSREVRWATCHYAGPDSVVQPGDEILLSARPVSYTFQLNGVTMHNTSDKSCLAYRNSGELRATGETLLYTWLEEPEEVTTSGIVLVRRTVSREEEPRWAKVVAAGPEAKVQPGDEVLLAWKADNYKIEIDGMKLMNAGAREIIVVRPKA
jgi:co-chaperonin GroES (HSP10)